MSIRFLILSDTHDSAFPDPGSLPAVDVVIHCRWPVKLQKGA